jgi:hypothetical protein
MFLKQRDAEQLPIAIVVGIVKKQGPSGKIPVEQILLVRAAMRIAIKIEPGARRMPG